MEAARNDEQLLRRVNDDRRKRFGQSHRVLALVCECGDSACRRAVVLTVDEYDASRPGLILHPEHKSSA